MQHSQEWTEQTDDHCVWATHKIKDCLTGNRTGADPVPLPTLIPGRRDGAIHYCKGGITLTPRLVFITPQL